MVYGHHGEVLQQRSTAPDVQDLYAKADREDGFVEVMRVLDEEFVDVFAGVVGGSGGFERGPGRTFADSRRRDCRAGELPGRC